MQLKSRFSVIAYNALASILFRPNTPPEKMRARFEKVGVVSKEKLKQKYPNLRFDDHAFDGVHVESTVAVSDPDKIIVHLHGGAYIMGSSASFRVRAKNISHRCNAKVYMIDYRQSPEHKFPSALEDVFIAWNRILDLHPDAPIFLSGDSCGGGLALALMMKLRDSNCSLPNAAVLISSWTDLAMTGDSIDQNAKKDGWLSRAHLDVWACRYLGDTSAENPLASPYYGDFKGLPALMFIVGDNEVILDDSLRCAEKAKASGLDVEVVVGKQMSHDYPLSLPWLAESKIAWSKLSNFLESNI